MSSFLDKLKKGMNIQKMPEIAELKEEEPEEETEEKEEEEEVEMPKIRKAVAKKPTGFKIKSMPLPEIKSVKSMPIFQEPKKVIVQKEKSWFDPEGQLTVDMYETDKNIIVKSAIAGIKPEDLDIAVENDMLIIKGRREESKEEHAKNYFYQECYWGKFSREIVLPKQVDPSAVEASMKDGVLTIRIPKLSDNDKRIRIREE